MNASRAVFIDDKCDVCGTANRMGVCYGPGLPVICEVCIEDGSVLLKHWYRWRPDPKKRSFYEWEPSIPNSSAERKPS